MSKIDTFSDPILNTWPVSGIVILLDLEYTSWEGSMQRDWSEDWEFREIVQIGAIRLSAEPGEFIIEETFERLVKPIKNPKISDYFSDLTGITNSMIQKKGYDFKTAFADFRSFVLNSSKIWSVGFDGEVLRENTILQQVPYPFHKNKIKNIRPALSKILDRPESQIVSSKLPDILVLPHSRRKHSALSDAMSIYQAINHLRKNALI